MNECAEKQSFRARIADFLCTPAFAWVWLWAVVFGVNVTITVERQEIEDDE